MPSSSPRGGRIDVSLIEHPDGRVEFRVSDDGIGIPSRALPHIFDRFWQADGHAREQRQGWDSDSRSSDT